MRPSWYLILYRFGPNKSRAWDQISQNKSGRSHVAFYKDLYFKIWLKTWVLGFDGLGDVHLWVDLIRHLGSIYLSPIKARSWDWSMLIFQWYHWHVGAHVCGSESQNDVLVPKVKMGPSTSWEWFGSTIHFWVLFNLLIQLKDNSCVDQIFWRIGFSYNGR